MTRRCAARLFVLLSAAALIASANVADAAAAASAPRLLHYGTVTRQDVRAATGSEPDTVVEPDVAVSPRNGNIAVAAAHDGRFADGGAVSVSYSWTHNGGASWHHSPLPRLTTATGGSFDRASDPVVAFAPDGAVYISTLLFNAGCDSAVAVSRSTDAGVHFGAPVTVHQSASCAYSDDKDWLVVDNGGRSPHRGRLYTFWTPFITTSGYVSSPQAVRYSDDHGRTWSATHYVTDITHGAQGSRPMIRADGSIVDTYYDFGPDRQAPDPDVTAGPLRRAAVSPTAVDATGPIYAARSTDGGLTWKQTAEITNAGGGYAPGVRCCLFGADIDALTGRMYVVYNGAGPGDDTDPVELSSSRDGVLWSSPVRVSTRDVTGIERVNVDVAARGGRVYVSYGTRTDAAQAGGFVQEQLSVSTNGGLRFRAPLSIGPRSVLKYAAQAGGYFPGDYIGSAVTVGRLYVVWARSSPPSPLSTSPYHQVIVGATLRP